MQVFLRPSLRAALFALALPALGLSLLGAGCATDDERPPPTRIETQPAVVKTQPAVVVAQPGPPPLTSPAEDAGAPDAAPAKPPSTAFIYDRVLAKLDDPAAADLAVLERAIEKRSGAAVKEIKKGPMGLLSIVFEEASPPRGEEEQRALVESLKGMPELRYAEPERLLRAH